MQGHPHLQKRTCTKHKHQYVRYARTPTPAKEDMYKTQTSVCNTIFTRSKNYLDLDRDRKILSCVNTQSGSQSI